MRPTDPFEAEQLANEKEAFEYSGKGQFLQEKMRDLTDAIENLQMEIGGHFDEATERNQTIANQSEDLVQTTEAFRLDVDASFVLIVWLLVGNLSLLGLILWRVW